MKTKSYPHVTGLYGDSGENPSALAIHAVLDPSPNYPENGRIIAGSPATTPTIDGYIPNLGGFNGGPAAIERLASTLFEAARDVRAAMGSTTPGVEAIDLSDTELGAAETLIDTLDRLNVRAAVDPDAMQAARLLQRMAAEIRRRRTSGKRIRELVPDLDAVFDEVERHRAEQPKLDAIAKAATAFVDEQGKTLSRDLVEHAHFADKAFADLVRAVEGAGR